jgi:hypothetical protein
MGQDRDIAQILMEICRGTYKQMISGSENEGVNTSLLELGGPITFFTSYQYLNSFHHILVKPRMFDVYLYTLW